MTCGKGAYVRAIARDLGLGARLPGPRVRLRRTEVGGFNVGNAVSLDALARIVEDDTLLQVLVPMTTRAGRHPGTGRHGTAGAQAPVRAVDLHDAGPGGRRGGRAATVRAMRAGELIALARLEGMELSPVRVFHHGPMPTGNRE